MIGILDVGTFIPQVRVDNMSRQEQFDVQPGFLLEKIGFKSLARKELTTETSDLCVAAFENLRSKSDFNKDRIDCIIVCTQNPDGAGLPQVSSIVQQKLNLSVGIAAFDISLGCSGFVYASNVITAFMTANGFKTGLLFTADPYSKILDSSDRNTELLFGDGATCTLFCDEPKYVLLKTLFGTDGSGSHAIAVNMESRRLEMRGQDVFRMTMRLVPSQIESCLTANKLSKEDIGLFAVHQGSKYIVDNLAKALDLPADKMPFLATDVGNTVSSTLPLILADHMDKNHKYILLSGFGVGFSWATTILKSALE